MTDSLLAAWLLLGTTRALRSKGVNPPETKGKTKKERNGEMKNEASYGLSMQKQSQEKNSPASNMKTYTIVGTMKTKPPIKALRIHHSGTFCLTIYLNSKF